jgi:hypothetical protein
MGEHAEALLLIKNGLKSYDEQLPSLRKQVADTEALLADYRRTLAGLEEAEMRLKRSLAAMQVIDANKL